MLGLSAVGRSPKPPDTMLAGTSTSPRCALFVLAHVPKTGGSTISEVFQALPDWEFLGRPNSGHPLFFAAYGSLFAGTRAFSWSALPSACQKHRPNASALEGSSCLRWGSMAAVDWRSRRIVVDFHEPKGLAKFHSSLVPRLSALRERYAEAGCAFQMGTVLREPASQMLSEFLYFHVAFNAGLHGNATAQEDTLVDHWLRKRANPQLAWLRGRSCRMVGLIFMCSTPPNEPCGDGIGRMDHATANSSDDMKASELHATDGAMRLLREFDVVGTSKHIGEVLWSLAARVGVFLNESHPLKRPTSTSSNASSSISSGGNSSESRHAPHGKPPTAGDGFHCNPPMKVGRISLDTLSPSTLRILRDHSRCDRRLYEAALLREAAELAFTAKLAQQRVQGDDESMRRADERHERHTQHGGAAISSNISSTWTHSLVGALYTAGSAYRVASDSGLMPPFGILNMDPALLAANCTDDLIAVSSQAVAFSRPFHCKRSR